MLAQRRAHRGALLGRGHPEAREQLALLAVLDPAGRPADGQALEEELDRALPGVLASARRQLGVLAPRRGRHRPAQLERAAGVVDARRRAELLPPRPLAQATSCPRPARAGSARRRSAGRRGPATPPRAPAPPACAPTPARPRCPG